MVERVYKQKNDVIKPAQRLEKTLPVDHESQLNNKQPYIDVKLEQLKENTVKLYHKVMHNPKSKKS